MQFFVDSADLQAIKDLADTGMVDGATTNPSLVAKSGQDFKTLIAEICDLVPGPVSAEVTALEADAMLKEADELLAIADNVCIKVPLTWDGLKATRQLADRGKKVNVTLCFSANQALLAAKAGAAYISPFVGRLDDIGADGMGLIADIRQIYDNYPELETEILVASVRSPEHMRAAALIGADVATLPPEVLRSLIAHPLTDKGLDAFLADWKKTGQSIA
ncbi:MAG: fructose-6-phosphate aldolase [Rhodobiaceae bacterium]|jgi:transaldolase|nr:fructose-6-phosphate aldolase [Rhodobiaceae bacterium]MBT5518121.1 fructose-6-phosphate aldolase [Rhodobiaceae bacterium]MBT7279394.1 fructose-6-phosphate aldolase [Rhodobiaceae bacterium]MDG2496431.1 fructose-6-phosphate aldolase [Alphaproteobacteria bacterium]